MFDVRTALAQSEFSHLVVANHIESDRIECFYFGESPITTFTVPSARIAYCQMYAWHLQKLTDCATFRAAGKKRSNS